mmetsp:Transcript_17276/g.45715  ORF Transcript_17276/g.45715 Transcript_17276/m.45715 type:complete len:349 (+) Transcript_17276:974-2020(+)
MALPARYHVSICGSERSSRSSAARRRASSSTVPSRKTTLLPSRKCLTAHDLCTEPHSSSKRGRIACLQRSMRPSGNRVPLSKRRGWPIQPDVGRPLSSCRKASKHAGPGTATGSASGKATACRGRAQVFGAARRRSSRAASRRASCALRSLCRRPSNLWWAEQPSDSGKKRCAKALASSPPVPRWVFGTRTQRSEKGRPDSKSAISFASWPYSSSASRATEPWERYRRMGCRKASVESSSTSADDNKEGNWGSKFSRKCCKFAVEKHTSAPRARQKAMATCAAVAGCRLAANSARCPLADITECASKRIPCCLQMSGTGVWMHGCSSFCTTSGFRSQCARSSWSFSAE